MKMNVLIMIIEYNCKNWKGWEVDGAVVLLNILSVYKPLTTRWLVALEGNVRPRRDPLPSLGERRE